jgi:DNA repair protein RecO (recombination protein O)
MIESRAIITRLTKLGDTSWIVHWLTEDYGPVKTVAKGARQPKSPFFGKLDLFFGGNILYQSARRGELHSLREVTICDWRLGLRSDYPRVLLAAYCCQLLEATLPTDHPEPDAHDLLLRALNHLDQAPASRIALTHFERELTRLLGIHHPAKPAAASLREILGSLPPSRNQLLESLPHATRET